MSSRTEYQPRIEVSREDSTEVIIRMEDGNTPVGGPLVSVEVSSRMEGVPPSRERGSEERGAPEDPMLERTYGSEMCISEMQVILQSLGVASASGEVAQCSAEAGLAVQLSTWISGADSWWTK